MKLPFRRRREDELNEEISSHIKMSVNDRVESGESYENAQHASIKEIGNVGLIKEVTRQIWGWASIERLFQDLRYGFRVLRKSPAFTIVVVLSLALGIGANTAIFSLVDKVLLRTLPVDQPDRLVLVGFGGKRVSWDFNYPDFAAYRDRNEVLEGLICFSPTPLTLNGNDRTERVRGLLVSGNYFDTLKVIPALGRGFLPEEDKTRGAHPVVVISYGLWKSNFGAEPGIIGRAISINGRNFTVVGVAPAEFTGTAQGDAPDIYIPMMMQAEAQPGDDGNPFDPREGRHYWWLYVMGRLKDGVSRERAESAMTIVADQVANEFPHGNGSLQDLPKIILGDGRQGFTDATKDFKFPLKMLMVIVGLVLLIACANVANLLLARAGARHKEIAVRLALGAGRLRLIRQLLTESLLLAMLGGIAGLILTILLGRFLAGFAPPTLSSTTLFSVNLDGRVLGFTLLLSLLTGIVFGLAPAFVASRTDLIPDLKDKSLATGKVVRRLSLKNVLIIVQVALSLIVLMGAGLCVRSLYNLQSIDSGFGTTKILTMSVDMNLNNYDETRGRQFIPAAIERISAIPGIESASMASVTPLSGLDWGWSTLPEGYQPQPGEVLKGFSFNVIGPDYFRTMKIPVVAGREFTSADTKNSKRVAIINETLANNYFPNINPIGKHLIHGRPDGNSPSEEIVGIVKDSKNKNLTSETKPVFYCPFSQNYQNSLTLMIRTASDPASAAASVRQAIQSLDRTLPVYDVKTLEELKTDSLYTSRFAAMLLTFFGLLALLLASIGIYGVMAYTVNRRTREIGIRMALGAHSGSVFKMVITEGMVLVVFGLIIGTAGAIACGKFIESFLYGVRATDPATFISIGVLMVLVALLANYIPARAAVRVDPMVALRYE